MRISDSGLVEEIRYITYGQASTYDRLLAVNELAVQPPKDCFFVQNGIHDGFVNFYVTLLRIQKALGKTSDQGTAVVMDGIAAASYGSMSISIWIEIALGRKNVFMMQGVLDGKK